MSIAASPQKPFPISDLLELPIASGYFWPMRRFWFSVFLFALFAAVPGSQAATGRVVKVLPFFLDHKGKHTTAPSLYERDAYQVYLRDHPELRSGRMYSVQWKVKGKPAGPLLLRLELRGIAEGNLPRSIVVEKFVEPRGWVTNWDEFLLVDEDYARFGEVTAWRVSLWERGPWEEDTLLSDQTSFLY